VVITPSARQHSEAYGVASLLIRQTINKRIFHNTPQGKFVSPNWRVYKHYEFHFLRQKVSDALFRTSTPRTVLVIKLTSRGINSLVNAKLVVEHI
jgi:hypothetical protein